MHKEAFEFHRNTQVPSEFRSQGRYLVQGNSLSPLPEQLTLYGQSAALHPYQLDHLVLCNLVLFPIQDTNLENGAVRRGF